MATFSEWLVFEELREGVYEESLRRIRLHEALRKTFEFCNLAVAGRWDLILENSLEDEDDSVPDYDPFADGDENAPEVKIPTSELPLDRKRRKKKKKVRSLAPHELRGKYTRWHPPKGEEGDAAEEPNADSDAEVDFDIASGTSEPDLIRQAKEIQRLWRLARWAAMLDRKDLVERVKKIYDEELAPFLQQNESLRLEDINDDEDDWGDSYFADAKPQPKPNPAAAQPVRSNAELESAIKKVAERLKPLLEKLGYLRDSHLPDQMTDEERVAVILAKARIAKDETGNDPPDNESVKEMDSNPMLRRERYSRVMDRLSAIISSAAKKAFNRTTATVQDSEGRIRRGASRFLEDDFLNDAIVRAMEGITTRDVLQDGTVNPWDETTNAFNINIDDAESAQRYINSLKSPITRGSIKRDADREDRTAAGSKPSSDDRPVSMDAPVAGSDGEASTMQVADPRGRDSLSSSVAEEDKKTLVNAFRQAMIELRDMKPNGPSLAVLACLWMQLDCADDGSMPDGNISRFFSAASGIAAGSSQSARSFIDRLALDQHIPGTPKQKSELGEWALVKLIASRRAELQNMPRMDKIPAGNPPDKPPAAEGKSAYMSRHILSDSDKLWYAYQKKIADAKRDSISLLIKRMQQIIAENNPSMKPKGWRSPCSWSLFKFLNDTYHDAIGSTVRIGERESNPMTVTFFNKHKKSQKIREYSISIRGEFINITQTYPTGYEGENFRYEIPQSTVRCVTCQGSGGDCPECEGCGSTMDRVKTIKMETDIKARLELQRRKRGKKD